MHTFLITPEFKPVCECSAILARMAVIGHDFEQLYK